MRSLPSLYTYAFLDTAVVITRDIVVDLQIKYLQNTRDIVSPSYRVRSMIGRARVHDILGLARWLINFNFRGDYILVDSSNP